MGLHPKLRLRVPVQAVPILIPGGFEYTHMYKYLASRVLVPIPIAPHPLQPEPYTLIPMYVYLYLYL